MSDEGVRCVTGHRIQIHERGGRARKHALIDLSQVSWGRELDRKSQAGAILTGRSCTSQADVLDEVARASRRFEMVAFRGKRRVWEGPIEQVETVGDKATITAFDVKHYLDHNPLSVDWPITTGEQKPPVTVDSPWLMTERIRAILDHELSTPYQMRVGTGGAATVVVVPRWEGITPPANVKPHLDIRRSETLYTRSNTVAFQMQIGEHLDALAEGGLDYTVIGRTILVWDSAYPLYWTRRLSEANFYGPLKVISSGTGLAAIGHTSAQRPDEPPATVEPGVVPGVGNAGGADDYYGVWTFLSSSDQEEGSEEPTQDELNSQSQRLIRGALPVPTEILVPGESGIRLSEALTIDDLVPGTIMPITATMNVRRVSQDQRLISMKVTETADGEKITAQFKSAGEVMAS